MKLLILGGICKRMFKSEWNISDCVYFFIMLLILTWHTILLDFLHDKIIMQISVLLASTINKYTNNDLTLDYSSDYFHLYGKYLLKVVK